MKNKTHLEAHYKLIRFLALLLAVAILPVLTSAFSTNTFNNSLTSETLTFPTSCYQEQTNSSTVGDGNCGLNYTGTYTLTRTINGNPFSDPSYNSKGYDGDFSTSMIAGYTNVLSILNIIYNIPVGINSGQLRYKDAVHGIVEGYISMPSQCNVGNKYNITISIQSPITASDYGMINYTCYNGTGNVNIRTKLDNSQGMDTGFYEEAMNWSYYDVTRYLSIPNTVSLLTNGYMNLTGYALTSVTSSNNFTDTFANTNNWNFDGSTCTASSNVMTCNAGSYNYNSVYNKTNYTRTGQYGINISAQMKATGVNPEVSLKLFKDTPSGNTDLGSGIMLFAQQNSLGLFTGGQGNNLNTTTPTIDVTAYHNYSLIAYSDGRYEGYYDGVKYVTYTTTAFNAGYAGIYLGFNDKSVLVKNFTIDFLALSSSNVTLQIGNSTSSFNIGVNGTTPLTVRTSNLYSVINSYLTNAYLVGSNYLIPFVFSSGGEGNITYSNLQFDNQGTIINSVTYNANTLSGSLENFSINATYDTGYYTSVNPILTYNNTNYSLASTGNGIFSTSIFVPTVTTTTVVPFYFTFLLTNSTGDITSFQSSTYNQNIDVFLIDNCSSFTNPLLNFTIYDEDSFAKINGVIEFDGKVYDSTGTNLIGQYNATLIADATHQARICINSTNVTYALTYIAKYYGNSSYFQQFKTVQNMLITNSTPMQNIPLYDLLVSRGYPFTVSLFGVLTPGNIIVEAQRQYLPINSFVSVESTFASVDKNAVLHLVPQSEVYNFIVYQNGKVIGTFNNFQVQCQNTATGQCTISLNLAASSGSLSDLNNFGNITGYYTVDRINGILSFTFYSTDNIAHLVTQNVVALDNYGNTTICSNSVTATSGTLSCTLPTLYQNTTVTSIIFSDGTKTGSSSFSFGVDNDYKGVDIFIELLLVSTLVLLFIAHPILIIIGAISGIGLSTLLLYVTGASMTSIIGVIIYFVIVGFILIWQIGRKIF